MSCPLSGSWEECLVLVLGFIGEISASFPSLSIVCLGCTSLSMSVSLCLWFVSLLDIALCFIFKRKNG